MPMTRPVMAPAVVTVRARHPSERDDDVRSRRAGGEPRQRRSASRDRCDRRVDEATRSTARAPPRPAPRCCRRAGSAWSRRTPRRSRPATGAAIENHQRGSAWRSASAPPSRGRCAASAPKTMNAIEPPRPTSRDSTDSGGRAHVRADQRREAVAGREDSPRRRGDVEAGGEGRSRAPARRAGRCTMPDLSGASRSPGRNTPVRDPREQEQIEQHGGDRRRAPPATTSASAGAAPRRRRGCERPAGGFRRCAASAATWRRATCSRHHSRVSGSVCFDRDARRPAELGADARGVALDDGNVGRPQPLPDPLRCATWTRATADRSSSSRSRDAPRPARADVVRPPGRRRVHHALVGARRRRARR